VSDLVAYLETQPDDWPSWLAYANELSRNGDERGQMLVLAHRLHTLPSEDAELRRKLERLEDEWLESSGLYGDCETYAQIRGLTSLATPPTPDGLRPMFARPITQLLALVTLEERNFDEISPVFARYLHQVTSTIVTWIERAFDGVPPPDDQHRTLYQAEAADNYDDCDRSRDYLGRWQDFPEEQLLANQWAIPHLDRQGILYYLPAIMTFALRHPHHCDDTWLTFSLECTLKPSAGTLREYDRSRFSLFNRDQRAAIYAYTLIRNHQDGAEAWSRVFAAERYAEQADWFEHYSPADSRRL